MFIIVVGKNMLASYMLTILEYSSILAIKLLIHYSYTVQISSNYDSSRYSSYLHGVYKSSACVNTLTL